MREYYTTKDVAKILNISTRMVLILIETQGLPAIPVSGTARITRRIDPAALQQWVTERSKVENGS
ncbi:helix-turn-helix domain-containing protein [Anatilimnocola floriformis]|uniref:helix-turn-helix domain-containing protein n=1 Tax=Anatilimnocola floriformis TaxID=2948575 RepID=UPI0036F3DA56